MRWISLMVLAGALVALSGCPTVVETDGTPDTVVVDNTKPADNTTIIEHDKAPDTNVNIDVTPDKGDTTGSSDTGK